MGLTASLTDGHTHAVVVTGEDRRILGIITQSDLLATLTRLLSTDAIAIPASAPL